jgi:hypothetical protein
VRSCTHLRARRGVRTRMMGLAACMGCWIWNLAQGDRALRRSAQAPRTLCGNPSHDHRPRFVPFFSQEKRGDRSRAAVSRRSSRVRSVLVPPRVGGRGKKGGFRGPRRRPNRTMPKYEPRLGSAARDCFMLLLRSSGAHKKSLCVPLLVGQVGERSLKSVPPSSSPLRLPCSSSVNAAGGRNRETNTQVMGHS